MLGELMIDYDSVEDDASEIEGIASQFQMEPLKNIDETSTITANSSCQQAYSESQTTLETFGKDMEDEVNNIRSMGATFQQYDTMLTELIQAPEIKYDSVLWELGNTHAE